MNKITEKQGAGAFEIHQNILALKKQMGVAFIELGRLLKQIRDENYYQVLGYDNFTSYIINSELGFSRRTAYNYIEIYEWYVEKLAYETQFLAEIGQEKLRRALYIIKEEYPKLPYFELRKYAGQLITEVKELRPVDFEKKRKDDKLNEGYEDYLAPPEYFRCDKCGKWKMVIPIEDCCPDWLMDFKKQLKKRRL
jgi:hypothetical protein